MREKESGKKKRMVDVENIGSDREIDYKLDVTSDLDWPLNGIVIIIDPGMSCKDRLINSLISKTKDRANHLKWPLGKEDGLLEEIVSNLRNLYAMEEKQAAIMILDGFPLETPEDERFKEFKSMILEARAQNVGIWFVDRTMRNIPAWLECIADVVLIPTEQVGAFVFGKKSRKQGQ